MQQSPITTHILDTTSGRPASGVSVELAVEEKRVWRVLATGTTNADGRITDLLPAETAIVAGNYRFIFHTGAYFQQQGVASFYPAITIVFTIRQPQEHHHVPLLLTPFGYTTYRGS